MLLHFRRRFLLWENLLVIQALFLIHLLVGGQALVMQPVLQKTVLDLVENIDL
jgi:fumarate reductase subunit C